MVVYEFKYLGMKFSKNGSGITRVGSRLARENNGEL